jgi:sialate O-acetylesterase
MGDTMTNDQVGAMLDEGPSDWQIIQQGYAGSGRLELKGHWVSETPGVVQVRLAHEDTSAPVNERLDWHTARANDDHTWSDTLEEIPAGGLYRLETRFNAVGNLAGEWSTRGDMRHFLGVGDLWVIAGQSNSAGYGRGPFYDPPELGVHLYRNSEQWALATHPLNESTDTRHAVNRENANSGHSPYLHFARLLKQGLHYPIGLVQTALGGSALAPWNPTETKSAVLFNNMLHCVRCAGGAVKGIVWYQGETDADTDICDTYARRFDQAVCAWREALREPDLPVIVVQLNRVRQPATADSNRRWTVLRDAQRRAPALTRHVAVVPTLDLPLSDGVHNSPAGNMLLAERMARAALGMVYGKPVDYLAPEAKSARRQENDTVVEVSFANVKSRMDCIDPTANCFYVEDEQGSVAVQQVQYPGDARVRLVLARALDGIARLHGAYGIDPAIVPMDMERFIPMLGFANLQVD